MKSDGRKRGVDIPKTAQEILIKKSSWLWTQKRQKQKFNKTRKKTSEILNQNNAAPVWQEITGSANESFTRPTGRLLISAPPRPLNYWARTATKRDCVL